LIKISILDSQIGDEEDASSPASKEKAIACGEKFAFFYESHRLLPSTSTATMAGTNKFL
jgi:hypothetical protein